MHPSMWLSALVLCAAQVLALTERDALMQLYNAVNGPNWTTRTNWGVGDPCTNAWSGVTCQAGFVTSLQLINKNLVGVLPDIWQNFTRLNDLQLYSNVLSGGLPSSFDQLPSMVTLGLGSNNLSGPLPRFLASTQMTRLNVDLNSFTSVPDWTHMVQLYATYIYGNPSMALSLSNQSIPWNRATLREIRVLATSSLTINPEGYMCTNPWTQCTSSLARGVCAPRGCTCTSMPQCPAVEKDALMQLYNLNNGTGWTRKANWTVGDPCANSWQGVTCAADRIVSLDLAGNGLNGTLPDVWFNLKKLQVLQLGNNQLIGALPASLGEMPGLTSLLLNGNNFTGTVSDSSAVWNRTSVTAISLTETSTFRLNMTGYLCTKNWQSCSIVILANTTVPAGCICAGVVRAGAIITSSTATTTSSSSIAISTPITQTSLFTSNAVTPTFTIAPPAAVTTSEATEPALPTGKASQASLAIVISVSVAGALLALGGATAFYIVRRRRAAAAVASQKEFDHSKMKKELRSYISGITSILMKPITEETAMIMQNKDVTQMVKDVEFAAQA